MTFTGPDRAGAERESGGGLGVPRRTKVLVAVVLLGMAFWAGWWARGKLAREEGAAPVAGGGEQSARPATSEAGVVVFEGALGAADGASVAGPDVAPIAATTPAPGLDAGPDVADVAPAPPVPPGADAGAPLDAASAHGSLGMPAADASPTPAPEARERMTWAVDRDGIQGAVREAVPDIRECYEGWLRANPALAGKVTVRFTIASDPDDAERGKVTRAALVASDVAHPLMEGCVLNVMSGLAFEAPSDGKPLDVNYPIILQTDEP
jgi:hypothetical protein